MGRPPDTSAEGHRHPGGDADSARRGRTASSGSSSGPTTTSRSPSPAELLARVRRFSGVLVPASEWTWSSSPIPGSTSGPSGVRAGTEVRLTRKEFDLLRYLVEHRGEILTRERLLDEVLGLRALPHDSDGRHSRPPAPAEVRARSRAPRTHPDGPRRATASRGSRAEVGSGVRQARRSRKLKRRSSSC